MTTTLALVAKKPNSSWMHHQIMKSKHLRNRFNFTSKVLRWFHLHQAQAHPELKDNVKAVHCSCGPTKLRSARKFGWSSGYRPACEADKYPLNPSPNIKDGRELGDYKN